MISASFDAWPRLSRRSQPKSRMMVRYRSRISTVRDLAPSRSAGQTAGHGLRIEFWSGTRSRPSPRAHRAQRQPTCQPRHQPVRTEQLARADREGESGVAAGVMTEGEGARRGVDGEAGEAGE